MTNRKHGCGCGYVSIRDNAKNAIDLKNISSLRSANANGFKQRDTVIKYTRLGARKNISIINELFIYTPNTYLYQ